MSRSPVVWAAVAVLVAAGAIAPLRPLALVALVAGWAVLAWRRAPAAVAWAAAIPVAVAMAWPFAWPPDGPRGAACVDPWSPVAWGRVVECALVLLAVAGLRARVGGSWASLGLSWPRPAEVLAGVTGVAVIAAGSLWVGPALAEPFFGRLAFPMPAAALVPALVFGVANGVAEEVAYRGALLRWLGRAVGVGPALVVQALVFGLVHAGPDVVGLLPLHVALLGGAGLLAGLVAVRTGSLALPIAAHVGADIALYYGLACRPLA
jgi:membrane protease YdiL (CAAX protease family)